MGGQVEAIKLRKQELSGPPSRQSWISQNRWSRFVEIYVSRKKQKPSQTERRQQKQQKTFFHWKSDTFFRAFIWPLKFLFLVQHKSRLKQDQHWQVKSLWNIRSVNLCCLQLPFCMKDFVKDSQDTSILTVVDGNVEKLWKSWLRILWI